MGTNNLETIFFESTHYWQNWLEKNHKNPVGIWLKFAKKESGIISVTYDEALKIALCWGWIDGQKKSFDNLYWLQKFTARSPKSIWSKRNCEIVTQLIAEGKMQPAGLEKIESAKKDGRWEKAYDSPKNRVIPADFLKELANNKAAETFFKTLNKTNIYAITWRLQTAKKPETREKQMKKILEMLTNKKSFH